MFPAKSLDSFLYLTFEPCNFPSILYYEEFSIASMLLSTAIRKNFVALECRFNLTCGKFHCFEFHAYMHASFPTLVPYDLWQISSL